MADSRDEDRRDPTEGFLSRWSRRKREDPPPPAPLPVAASQPEDDQRPRDPETGEPIDEELVASLPKLEEIKPGADLSAFMRRGVPEAMKRQALRLMWETDPAIRDFVSPALDYAYDYNAPGGAPGYGPLTESDMAQARDLISRVFSDPGPPREGPASAGVGASSDKESQDVAAVAPAAVRRSDVAGHNADESAATSDLTGLAKAPENAGESAPATDEMGVRRSTRQESDASGKPVAAAGETPRKRRGGGAAPV